MGKQHTPEGMLGALLKQAVAGLDNVSKEIMKEIVQQGEFIGGQSLRLDQIVKMLAPVTSLKSTFTCVGAPDKCAVGDLAKNLISLGKILQKSPAAWVFLTGRPHVHREIEHSHHDSRGVAAVSASLLKMRYLTTSARAWRTQAPTRGGLKPRVGIPEDHRNCLGL